MEFVLNGTSVECHRPRRAADGSSLVTTFDAHLTEIAPHIRGALTVHEQRELKRWFSKRSRQTSAGALRSAFERIERIARRAKRVDSINSELSRKRVAALSSEISALEHALEYHS
ncbi:MAG: hypothetical protein ACU84Q_05345 [Gammaproteobacteria bacterium]